MNNSSDSSADFRSTEQSTFTTQSQLDRVSLSRRCFLSKTFLAAGTLLLAHTPAFARSLNQTEPDFKILKEAVKGQVVTYRDADFEDLAFGELWNKLRPNPNRIPQVIVKVMDEEDVSTAIKFARTNKMKVSVRGGGHNWCNPSLRQGGMMIDLTNLDQVESIDKENRRAVVQPVVSNRDVQKPLNAQGLAFPSGHCPPVKLSGYLLSGGMSWNQGVWGHGVHSVEAIEMVTASGERITASNTENQDYFWAARGAGPGFFGVVTKYHLKLYPLPQYITASSYTYALDDLATVAKWLDATASKLTPNVELSLFLLNASVDLKLETKDNGGKVCMVTATVFAENETEAHDAVKLLDTCPVFDKCLAKSVNTHVNFETLFDMSGALWPGDRRNQVDAQFSNAAAEDLFGSVAEHFKKAPSSETLIMFAFFTGPNVPAPIEANASFSMTGKFYGGPWTMWKEPKHDPDNIAWHAEAFKLLQPHVVGHYIAESDMVARPDVVKKSYSADNYKKIEELRTKYDPHGVFFNYFDGLA